MRPQLVICLTGLAVAVGFLVFSLHRLIASTTAYHDRSTANAAANEMHVGVWVMFSVAGVALMLVTTAIVWLCGPKR